MITTVIIGEKIMSSSNEAYSLNEKSSYGEKIGGKIHYSPTETLYLQENKKLVVIEGKKELSHEQLLRKLQRKNKRITINYPVYKDLRNRGHIVKTGLKYGAEFRVYKKGTNMGKDHAEWVLYPVREEEKTGWQEFSSKNRVAHSTKKKLLIAVVDDEERVTYYEVLWKKL